MSRPQSGIGVLLILLAIVLVGAIAGAGWYVWDRNRKPAITNFEECAAAGYPIMESYPEQCAANGQTFTRQLTDEEKKNLQPPAPYDADI